MLRLSLHPDGLQRRILNFREWRAHVLSRLAHEAELSGDARLAALLDELQAYPMPAAPRARTPASAELDLGGVAIPLQYESDHGVLSLISTTTVFGTPVDLTLAELALETFFPADAFTAQVLQSLAKGH